MSPDKRISEMRFVFDGENLSEALHQAAEHIASKERAVAAVSIEKVTTLFAVEALVVDYESSELRLYIGEWEG
jgi:hypothetical protein